MNRPDSFERSVVAWLSDAAGSAQVDQLDRVLERTAAVRQRPAWTFRERWLPVELSIRRLDVPRPVLVGFVVVALVLALVGLAIVAGSIGKPPWQRLGPAGNGLLVDDAGSRITVLGANGSGGHAITDGTSADVEPVWSANGEHIVYFSWPFAPGTRAAAEDAPDQPIGSVIVVDPDGSHRVVLAEGLQLATNGVVFPARWSHDGRRVAFGATVQGVPTVMIASLDAATIVRIADGDAPTWSPDDSKVAFRRNGTGVFVAATDGAGDPRQLGDPLGSGFAFAMPPWSPDGRHLLFYAGPDGRHDVYIADLDGNAAAIEANTRADEYWPEWSPDGTRIAFQRVVNDNNEINFVVTDATGRNGRQLETKPLGAWVGTWSPDGRFLVGHSQSDSGFNGIVLVDVENPAASVTIPSTAASIDWQRIAP